MNHKIKVLLVDDHTIFRTGLRSLLQQQPGIEVVGEAADGRNGITLTEELLPDVVIMDLSMPGLNGIDATAKVRAAGGAKVIALSAHSDARRMQEMLRAGASGYIIKDESFDQVADAIHTVMRHETYISPALQGVGVG